MTLTKEEALKVFNGLSHGYREVASRMQFARENKKVLDDENVCTHVLGYRLPDSIKSTVHMYDETVDSQIKQLLDPYINRCIDIINEITESVDQIFLIMSTNWSGKERHFKHIHTLLQNDPQRCITLSFPIPLFIDENSETYHKFYWYYQPNLFPKITYTSQNRMERLKVEYTSVDIPKKSISSLLFDSSRMPHYIDNTDHLYLWLVCDAVKMKDAITHSGLKLDLHGEI
jgi:hypothetical protein